MFGPESHGPGRPIICEITMLLIAFRIASMRTDLTSPPLRAPFFSDSFGS